MINNPIFTLVGYDGYIEIPQFAEEIIDKIRENIFEFIKWDKNKNYVLTNYLGKNDLLYKKVENMAFERGLIFVPVKLSILQAEHIKRVQNTDRLTRYKSTDVKYTKSEHSLIDISHPNLLELDVTDLTARTAAKEILAHVALLHGSKQIKYQ